MPKRWPASRLGIACLVAIGIAGAVLPPRPSQAAGEQVDWRRRPARLPPLFWYEPDPYSDDQLLMVGSLYWRGRWGGRSLDALAPFYMEHRSAERTLRATTPFFWRVRGANKLVTVAGPLFLSQGPAENTVSLLPLFWHSQAEGKSHTIVLPLYYRKADRAVPSTRGIAGPYVWDHWRDRRTNVLFPVFWHDRRDGRTLSVVPPLYVSAGKDRRAWGLFPLAKAYREPQSRGFYLFPLASFQRRAGKAYTFYLFPYIRSREAGAKDDIVLPLVWLHRKKGDNGCIVGLVYWDKDALGLFPLARLSRGQGSSGASGHVGPYFWDWGKEGYNVLFPVLWSYWRPAARTRTIPPLYHSRTDPKHNNSWGYLGPVYWRSAPSVARVVFPVFWHMVDNRADTSRTIAVPYYTSRHGNDFSTGVFPFYRHARVGTVSSKYLLPLYFSRQDSSREESRKLYGLYYRKRGKDRATDAVFPVFWRGVKGQTSKGYCLAYIWSRSPGSVRRILFPLLWLRQTGTGDQAVRSTVLPPFYLKRGPGTSKCGLFPLAWRHRDRDRLSCAVLPLFYRSTARAGRRSRLLAGPVLLSKEGNSRLTALVPIVWVKRSPTESRVVVAPLCWVGWNSQGDQSRGLLGPWYWRTQQQARRRVLFPVWWHSSDGQSAFNVVPPLYWGTGPVRSKVGLFPILWRHRGPDGSSVAFLPIFWREKNTAKNLSQGLVGLYYWKLHGGATCHVLFPLFWRYKDDVAFNLVVPPFYRLKTRDRTRLGVAPLFWHSSSSLDGAARTILLPLFYMSRAPEASTVVTPLWWRQRRGGSERGLAGPYYWEVAVSKDGQASAHVLFPLLWHFKDRAASGVESSSALVLPFYFRRQSPERRTHVIVPFVFSRNTPESSLLLVPPVLIHRRSVHQWKRVSVPPLFSKESDDTGYRYLGFLCGFVSYQTQYFHGKPKSRLSVFWRLRIPL